MNYLFLIIVFIVVIILLRSIVQIDEYERGVKFSRGKFSKIMDPGWNIVLPIFESYKKIDIRTKVVDVPEQDVITKDNVSVRINAVIYYKIFDASKAILEVENVELKDVSLPEEMKRVIAKAAEAEREKEAILTKAKGEVEASKNLAIAAETMSSTPGAMHLRTLSTINDISSDQSNTIIFCLPIEVLEAIKGKSINEDVIKKITKKDN